MCMGEASGVFVVRIARVGVQKRRLPKRKQQARRNAEMDQATDQRNLLYMPGNAIRIVGIPLKLCKHRLHNLSGTTVSVPSLIDSNLYDRAAGCCIIGGKPPRSYPVEHLHKGQAFSESAPTVRL